MSLCLPLGFFAPSSADFRSFSWIFTKNTVESTPWKWYRTNKWFLDVMIDINPSVRQMKFLLSEIYRVALITCSFPKRLAPLADYKRKHFIYGYIQQDCAKNGSFDHYRWNLMSLLLPFFLSNTYIFLLIVRSPLLNVSNFSKFSILYIYHFWYFRF